jgi:hypothetical protein
MHPIIRKLLTVAAVIVVAPPAFANVITDWNENAVTFVTPRMGQPRPQERAVNPCGRHTFARSAGAAGPLVDAKGSGCPPARRAQRGAAAHS